MNQYGCLGSDNYGSNIWVLNDKFTETIDEHLICPRRGEGYDYEFMYDIINWLHEYKGMVPRHLCYQIKYNDYTIFIPCIGSINRVGRSEAWEERNLTGLKLDYFVLCEKVGKQTSIAN